MIANASLLRVMSKEDKQRNIDLCHALKKKCTSKKGHALGVKMEQSSYKCTHIFETAPKTARTIGHGTADGNKSRKRDNLEVLEILVFDWLTV